MTNDVRQMVGGKFVRSFGARNDTHQSIASARPLRAIAFRRPNAEVVRVLAEARHLCGSCESGALTRI